LGRNETHWRMTSLAKRAREALSQRPLLVASTCNSGNIKTLQEDAGFFIAREDHSRYFGQKAPLMTIQSLPAFK
jgi:hypothetical protein